MGDVYFYHLTETPLEATLPTLLARAGGQGWRVELRGTDRARMAEIDAALWLGPEDGFLPHGLADGPYDALQPVILTVDGQRAGPTACLMAIDGVEVAPDEARSLQRVCILFDGNDEVAKDRARVQWRSLTGAGLGAKYWAQQDGRWLMKQERAAAP